MSNPVPLLSICIPTFNRCEKVVRLIHEILQYPGSEIEVLVLDNCSTDQTEERLKEVLDPRFFYVRNQENIGGVLNPLKALSLGTGKFSILCLDKDFLLNSGIQGLIDALKLDSEVVFGHCELNFQGKSENTFYNKGYESITNMAYLSRHPTGMFYKVSDYLNLDILKHLFLKKDSFPFSFDLINAEMAMIGKGQKINISAFFTESKDDAGKNPSFTYNSKNVYFSPENRIYEFNTYIEDSLRLKLSPSEIFKLIFKLYGHGLWLTTFGYRRMIQDPYVCLHNNVSLKNVSFFELWKLNFDFSKYFMRMQLPIGVVYKLIVVFSWNVKFLFRSFLPI